MAQDTTAYGMDLYGRLALPELLTALAEVTEIKWLRLLYCYPTMVRQPLLDVLRDFPKSFRTLTCLCSTATTKCSKP